MVSIANLKEKGERVWVRFFGYAIIEQVYPNDSHPYLVYTEEDMYYLRVIPSEVHDEPTEQDKTIGPLSRSFGKCGLLIHGHVYRDPTLVIAEGKAG